MRQDSLIEDHKSEMDDDNDDGGRDDWYKQVWWSDVSHINVCEGIRVKITKNVREKDEDGREEGREEREVSWEKTPFGKEVSLLLLSKWREWECDDEWNGDEDGKVFEVDIVVEDVWRKGGELIGIEVHEWREERNKE